MSSYHSEKPSLWILPHVLLLMCFSCKSCCLCLAGRHAPASPSQSRVTIIKCRVAYHNQIPSWKKVDLEKWSWGAKCRDGFLTQKFVYPRASFMVSCSRPSTVWIQFDTKTVRSIILMIIFFLSYLSFIFCRFYVISDSR
jgi:hypothetical protein